MGRMTERANSAQKAYEALRDKAINFEFKPGERLNDSSLTKELGISRSMVSTLYTVGTLTASFAMPFIGRQIDQRGSRQMTVIIVLVFGVACIYMGYVSNAFMLGIGFVALRMLGQGSLSLVTILSPSK